MQKWRVKNDSSYIERHFRDMLFDIFSIVLGISDNSKQKEIGNVEK